MHNEDFSIKKRYAFMDATHGIDKKWKLLTIKVASFG
jgi:hypothetical protein